MIGSKQHETMLRKPILMPPNMIEKVDKIAKSRKISFAKVVREAVDAFGGDASVDDMKILDALADTMIQTTQETVKKMEEVEKRFDATHTCWRLNNGRQWKSHGSIKGGDTFK